MSFSSDYPSSYAEVQRQRTGSAAAPRRSSSGTRRVKSGTTSKKAIPADDVAVRHIVGHLEAELNKRGKDLLSPLTRLSRLIQRQDSNKHFQLVKNTKTATVLLRVITSSGHDTVISLAVQSIATICSSSAKAATRMGRNGAGLSIVKGLVTHKSSKILEIKSGLYVCVANLASSDETIAAAFLSYGCIGTTVQFIKQNIGTVKLILPAVESLSLLVNEFSVQAYVEAKTVGLCMTIIQRYTGQLKYHTILKPTLKLMSSILQKGVDLSDKTYKSGVRRLIALLVEWVKLDTRNKHDTVRRQILMTLSKMISSDSGRLSFIEAGGIRIIMDVLANIESGSSVFSRSDKFAASCIVLLKKCRPSKPLPPVPAPLTFKLPDEFSELDEDIDVAESDEEEYAPSSATLNLQGQSKDLDIDLLEGDDAFDDTEETDILDEYGVLKDSSGESSDDNPSDDSLQENVPEDSLIDTVLEVDLRGAISQNSTLLDALTETPLDAINHEVSANVRPSTSDGAGLYRLSHLRLSDTRVVSSDDQGFESEADDVEDCDWDVVAEDENLDNIAARDDDIGDLSLPLDVPGIKTDEICEEVEFDESQYRSVPYDKACVSQLSEVSNGSVWELGKEKDVASMAQYFNEHTCDSFPSCAPCDLSVVTVRNTGTAEVPAEVFRSVESANFTREPLLRYHTKKTLRRKLLFDDMELLSLNNQVRDRVVYDVDVMDLETPQVANTEVAPLVFDSRFESGNLRRAVQVHDTLYDLVLSPDVNTEGHTQWFYFSVTGMVPEVRYRFNIVNLEKSNSQFNFGMQPVVLSEADFAKTGTGWRRAGTRIGYFKNELKRQSGRKPMRSNHYSATFSLTFRHRNDKCYIAFHYPYTYTDCMEHLNRVTTAHPDHIKRNLLCRTLAGNRCDLLTITSFDPADIISNPMTSRKYVMLSARVHPGETNASWMMQGLIDFLVGSSAAALQLRKEFIFKIVPMLNPDGVANGNHRCSLAGCDLNRKWRNPHPILHPTIYKTRLLFSYLKSHDIVPELYCDFHGHSRRKMVFMYGCVDSTKGRAFPKLVAENSPEFSIKNSRFNVTSDKEGSARVVIWREYGVLRSYTMEGTFCGFDRGAYHGDQVNPQDLRSVGRSVAQQLLQLLPAGKEHNVDTNQDRRSLGTASFRFNYRLS